jgi:hypothetical protein
MTLMDSAVEQPAFTGVSAFATLLNAELACVDHIRMCMLRCEEESPADIREQVSSQLDNVMS